MNKDLKLLAFFPARGEIKEINIQQIMRRTVVFFFYPKDFDLVTPTELNTLADRYDEIKKQGVDVYAISTDSAYSHKVWHENSPLVAELQFPMIEDENGKLGRLLGVFDEIKGREKRATVIVDNEKVVMLETYPDEIGRNIDELVRFVKAYMHFKRTRGREILPANWDPSKKTIKNDPKLAGKVYEVWP